MSLIHLEAPKEELVGPKKWEEARHTVSDPVLMLELNGVKKPVRCVFSALRIVINDAPETGSEAQQWQQKAGVTAEYMAATFAVFRSST